MSLFCPKCRSDSVIRLVFNYHDTEAAYKCEKCGHQDYQTKFSILPQQHSTQPTNKKFSPTIIFSQQNSVVPQITQYQGGQDLRIKNLEDTIKKLEKDFLNAQDISEKLYEENRTLKNKNKKITNKNKNLQNELDRLQNRIKILESENEELKNILIMNQKQGPLSPFGENPWTFTDNLNWNDADNYQEAEVSDQSILGQWISNQFPKQYKIIKMAAIQNDILEGGLEYFIKRTELRKETPGPLNPLTLMTPEKLIVINDLLSRLNPREKYKKVNTMYVWNGCSPGNETKIARNGFASINTDQGFFGAGIYATPNVEYAIRYSTGELGQQGATTPPWCVILSCCAMGMAYPVTRDVDYSSQTQCDLFGKSIKHGYDSHYIPVSQEFGFHACSVLKSSPQYLELVASHDCQLLPLVIIWFTN